MICNLQCLYTKLSCETGTRQQPHTLLISPSSITALLIFLKSSYSASTSLTLTAPRTETQPSSVQFSSPATSEAETAETKSEEGRTDGLPREDLGVLEPPRLLELEVAALEEDREEVLHAVETLHHGMRSATSANNAAAGPPLVIAAAHSAAGRSRSCRGRVDHHPVSQRQRRTRVVRRKIRSLGLCTLDSRARGERTGVPRGLPPGGEGVARGARSALSPAAGRRRGRRAG